MMAFDNVTNVRCSDRIISQPYPVDPPPETGFGPGSTQDEGVNELIATAQSARVGLAAFRAEMEAFVVLVAGLSPEALAGQEGKSKMAQVRQHIQQLHSLAKQIGPGDAGEEIATSINDAASMVGLPIEFTCGDLRTVEARDAFMKNVQYRFKCIQKYNEYIDAKTHGIKETSQMMKFTPESVSSVTTEDIDSSKALSLARLVASQVMNEPAILHGMADKLNKKTVTALLED